MTREIESIYRTLGARLAFAQMVGDLQSIPAEILVAFFERGEPETFADRLIALGWRRLPDEQLTPEELDEKRHEEEAND